MKASNLKKLMTSGFAIAIVMGIGFPLSSLLVADSQPVEAISVSDLAQIEDAGSRDAVSALMAGDTVGRVRGCRFGLRRPASVFIP